MLVLFGSNYHKKIRCSPKKYYDEIGNRFKELSEPVDKIRFKQQLGAIHLRVKKDFSVGALDSRDFNELRKLLRSMGKW